MIFRQSAIAKWVAHGYRRMSRQGLLPGLEEFDIDDP